MSVTRKLLAATGAGALSLLFVSAGPAAAATAPSGGFADANGIIVRLTALTAVPIPGPFGGTPIDPNTFASSSQSCPPTAANSDPHELLNVGAAPAAEANTIDTDALAKCSASDAVAAAAAQTEGLKALFNGAVPVITADVIRAQSNSDCTKAPNGAGSIFAGLSIAGQAIPADVPPNTTIPLGPIGSVIVNEQHPSANGRGFVVNGLHVIGASPLLRGDLIISHAVSGVVCPSGAGKELPPPEFTFDKDANPSTAHAGDTVTYTSTVQHVHCRLRRADLRGPPRSGVRYRVDGRSIREGLHDSASEALQRRYRGHSRADGSGDRRRQERAADLRRDAEGHRPAGDVLQQPRAVLRGQW